MPKTAVNSRGPIGNTKLAPKVNQDTCKSQIVNWFFTFNNYEKSDIDILIDKFSRICREYIFQEEIGEKTGTPHLQGTIKLIKPMRWSEFKLSPKIQWKSCRSYKHSVQYCQKEATRSGKIYTNMKLKKPLKLIDENKLYKWQKNILNIIKEEPSERTIYWLWEKNGNCGKSSFCKLLAAKYGALILSGKSSDMKYGIVNYMKSHNNIEPDIIILDVPRSNLDYLSYTGIEEVKNGCFFSSKYESEMCVFNSPHLFIFANEEPIYENMSKDRWKVIKIKKDEIEVPNNCIINLNP